DAVLLGYGHPPLNFLPGVGRGDGLGDLLGVQLRRVLCRRLRPHLALRPRRAGGDGAGLFAGRRALNLRQQSAEAGGQRPLGDLPQGLADVEHRHLVRAAVSLPDAPFDAQHGGEIHAAFPRNRHGVPGVGGLHGGVLRPGVYPEHAGQAGQVGDVDVDPGERLACPRGTHDGEALALVAGTLYGHRVGRVVRLRTQARRAATPLGDAVAPPQALGAVPEFHVRVHRLTARRHPHVQGGPVGSDFPPAFALRPGGHRAAVLRRYGFGNLLGRGREAEGFQAHRPAVVLAGHRYRRPHPDLAELDTPALHVEDTVDRHVRPPVRP